MFHIKSRSASNDFDEYANYVSRYGLKSSKKMNRNGSSNHSNKKAVPVHHQSIDFASIAKLNIDFDRRGNYDIRAACEDLQIRYEELTHEDFVNLSAFIFANRISKGNSFTLERI